jgi:hypothetical protein
MDVVVSGHAFVMLGGAKPGDLHSWVRVEVLRHERLLDIAEQHNIGPDMAFDAPGLQWNTIVSTPFGKRSVGGSAICASVGCIWLLDIAGYNKLSSSVSVISAPITFMRREMMKGVDDAAAAAAGGGTPSGKGYASAFANRADAEVNGMNAQVRTEVVYNVRHGRLLYPVSHHAIHSSRCSCELTPLDVPCWRVNDLGKCEALCMSTSA